MKGPIYDKSKELAIQGVKFASSLQNIHRYELANQFEKSVTSVGANIYEAHDAESKRDFIHKLKIAQKELNETIYWTEVISKGLNMTIPQLILDLIEDCRKLLNTIIAHTIKNMRQSKLPNSLTPQLPNSPTP
jgi:four helix bundle protein